MIPSSINVLRAVTREGFLLLTSFLEIWVKIHCQNVVGRSPGNHAHCMSAWIVTADLSAELLDPNSC